MAIVLGACSSDTAPAFGLTRLEPTSATSVADGATIVTLIATVDTSVVPVSSDVKFTTTAGALLPGTGTSVSVQVDVTGTATVQLRAPGDSAIALVSATVAGTTRTATVTFTPAVATRLEVSAQPLSTAQGAAGAVTVTAKLLRLIGKPSGGTLVQFSADTLAGKAGTFGTFSPPSVLAAGDSVTTRFVPGPTTYAGTVIIRIQATRGSTILRDSTIVQVIKP